MIIVERKNQRTTIWHADDYADAASKLNYKNGGWSAPFEVTAEYLLETYGEEDSPAFKKDIGKWCIQKGSCESEIVDEEPDEEDAAREWINNLACSDARDFTFLETKEEALEYAKISEDLFDAIAREF